MTVEAARAEALTAPAAQVIFNPNPADVPTAQAPGDHCVGVFPHYSYVHFLPLVRSAGDGGAPRLPNAGSGLSLGKQAGLLVPLGDQLGDVGQYYSQVAPSMVSTLTVENSTPLTQTFSLNLRSDRGVVARSLHRCPVAPGATLALQIKAGELWLADTNRQLPAASICEPTAAQAEPAGQALPTLQGIYHAELTTSAANPFTFTVETASDPNQPSIVYQTKSNYRAVPEQLARGTVYLPALVATRTQDNWWDTELVVQNVTHQATNLQFRLCDDEGRCFANNLATLQAYERRIFLASHLLYADDAGFLDERAGWFSATLTATPADDPGEDPRVVVLTNLFRQTVALNKREPQAEQGSDCLLQAELLAPTQQLDYTTTAVNEVVVRVYNPGPTTNAVQLNLVDHQGQPLKTLNALVAASGTAFWSIPDIFHETTSLPGETVTLQVQAQQAIVAFVWQNGSIVRPQTISQATTWYAPLVAAPTVPFRWDSSAGDPSRSTHPGSSFGLAETQRAYHPQRPEWARRLNWYIWSANQQSCNETVAEAEPYSTYIPMWWGLGGCSDAGNDRSCVNSPNRLQKLRNDLPSNCTGRPLFLANEPDLPAPQSFMTYHELGRLIYQLRSWPGELYSPVFASYAYDAPTYIAEPTPWCEQAVQNGWCPGVAGCSVCVQDGVVDGALDPHDISFKGLEDYFAAQGRWVRGQSWPFEKVIEGMLLHFYSLVEPFASDTYWRAPYLEQYRDRADQAGWPIIVSEYGFVIWPDHKGVFPDITACIVSEYADDLRRVLQKYLGDYQPEHGFNPKKLFWYHTGCIRDQAHRSENLCLFQDATRLTSPVGICWHDDATQGGTADRQCNQPCAQIFLPFVKP